eukprot:6481365-Amphidinium_carterae.1
MKRPKWRDTPAHQPLTCKSISVPFYSNSTAKDRSVNTMRKSKLPRKHFKQLQARGKWIEDKK